MIFFHEFDNQKEIKFLKFPFQVKKQHTLQLNILDGCFEHAPIIIRDSNDRIRGLYTLKTRIKTHFIGTNIRNTTNGGIFGDFPEGTWSLEVIKPSFRVSGKVQLEIRFDQEIINHKKEFPVLEQEFSRNSSERKEEWFSADLHCHSYYSDGRVDFEEIITQAEKQQLEIIALMDHSVITTQFPANEQLIIPGTEITMDNEVHYNAYGVKGLIDYSKYFEDEKKKNDCLNDMFSALHKQEVLLSINHPFAEGMTLRHDFDICNFDFLEVINAPYSTEDFIENNKAIAFFDFLWEKGHYLFGLGGSDAHKKNYQNRYPIGLPKNKIHISNHSISTVLQSMKKGKVFIENNFNSQLLITDEAGREVLPGSEIAGNIYFAAYGNKEVTWHIVKNSKVIFETVGFSCKYNVFLDKGDYVRLDAFIGDTPVLFVNPIFFQRKEKRGETSFEKLLLEFEN